MLKTIRKHRGSFLGLIIVGFTALVMVGFGLGSFFGPSNRGPLAKINEREISYREYTRQLQQLESTLRRRFGESYSLVEAQLDLKQQALDTLINDILLEQFTTEMGLSADNRQIRTQLESYPFFRGGFTRESYRNYLRLTGMSGSQLEALIRKDLVRSQLSTVLSDLSVLTPEEVRAIYDNDNASVKVHYVEFDKKDFEEQVNLEDEEALLAHYEDNKESYRKPKQVKFNYLRFDPAQYRDEVEVSEEDLRSLYDERIGDFMRPEQISLRQIFFKSAKKEDENPLPFDTGEDENPLESVVDDHQLQRQKAEDALTQLNEGEDFAELATSISEDDTTKEKGGDMGWLTYESLNPKLRSAARKLDLGQFSEIVETDAGFHLIYLEDQKPEEPKPFEEVRTQIERDLRNADAPLYAQAEAENFYLLWQEQLDTNLVDFAKSKEQEAKTTENFVSASSYPKELSREFAKKAVELDREDREAVTIGNDVYIVEVLEVKDAYIPEFEEVSDRIKREYKREQASVLASELADNVRQQLVGREGDAAEDAPLAVAKVKSLKDLADVHGREVKTTDAVERVKATDTILANPEIKRAAFALTPERTVADRTFDHNGKFYLIELAERTLPDEGDFEVKSVGIKSVQFEASGQRILESLVQHLRLNSEIWVNEELWNLI